MTTYSKFLNVAAFLQAGSVLIENLDGQGLHMEWTFHRTIQPEPDEGEIRIANLAPETSKLLQEQKVNLAPSFKGGFYQGWDMVPSLLFYADIYDIIPDDRSEPETTWTILRLGDGLEGFRDGQLTQGFGDVDIKTLITLVAGSMQIAVGADAETVIAQQFPQSNLTRFKNGIVAMDSARNVMNEIMNLLKIRWTVQNGQLVVFPQGQPISTLPAIVLRPDTGLLSWKTARDGSIEVEALSIPECTPGRQLLVQDLYGTPVGEVAYRVEEATYTGNTDVGAFMSVKAKKALI